MGIMDKKMETTIWGLGLRVYGGFLGVPFTCYIGDV